MFVYYNPNPEKKNVGDCTIRALSKALGQSWEKTYIGVVLQGYQMGDMPSANHVWGAYLRKHGYRRNLAEEDTTVNSFADRNPEGSLFLGCIQLGLGEFATGHQFVNHSVWVLAFHLIHELLKLLHHIGLAIPTTKNLKNRIRHYSRPP